MTRDRDERENLAKKRPLELQFLTDSFSIFVNLRREWRKRLWGVASNMSASAAEEIEKLVSKRK
jgi:hypothetical protein